MGISHIKDKWYIVSPSLEDPIIKVFKVDSKSYLPKFSFNLVLEVCLVGIAIALFIKLITFQFEASKVVERLRNLTFTQRVIR